MGPIGRTLSHVHIHLLSYVNTCCNCRRLQALILSRGPPQPTLADLLPLCVLTNFNFV